MAKKKMTEKEKEDWKELYDYVKLNIMGYDKNQSLSNTMVLRLKGLLNGKFIENKKIEDKSNYSYEIILNTFKFCSPTILKAFRNIDYKDEMHKFNIALKIAERNINDVYLRMRNVERAKEDSNNIITNTVNYTGAEYQRKTKEVSNKLLNDLW